MNGGQPLKTRIPMRWRNRAALRVRPFQSSDLSAVLRIWNSAHDAYAGHVVRTPAYWNWAIRQRPGVSDDDILILERGEPQGYGVMGPGGRVLELAIDPLLPKRTRRTLTDHLVIALEQRARHHAYDAIHFRVPDGDAIPAGVLRTRTYIADRSEHLQWVLLDLVAFFHAALAHRRAQVPLAWDRSFRLALEPGNYEFAPYSGLLIRVSPGRCSVEPTPSHIEAPHDTMLRTSLPTLADLILRRTTLAEALAAERIAVEPASATADVETLLRLVSISRPWFSPFADYR
jgi:hypothetical protein